jgi:hypothetical protein
MLYIPKIEDRQGETGAGRLSGPPGMARRRAAGAWGNRFAQAKLGETGEP